MAEQCSGLRSRLDSCAGECKGLLTLPHLQLRFFPRFAEGQGWCGRLWALSSLFCKGNFSRPLLYVSVVRDAMGMGVACSLYSQVASLPRALPCCQVLLPHLEHMRSPPYSMCNNQQQQQNEGGIALHTFLPLTGCAVGCSISPNTEISVACCPN